MWEQLNDNLSHHSRKRPVLGSSQPGATAPDPLRLQLSYGITESATLKARDLSLAFSKLGRLVRAAPKRQPDSRCQVFSVVCQPAEVVGGVSMSLQWSLAVALRRRLPDVPQSQRGPSPPGRGVFSFPARPRFFPAPSLLPGGNQTNPCGWIRGQPRAVHPKTTGMPECLMLANWSYVAP